MKIKSITLDNFANYDKVEVSLDSDVTYLVGKNGAGKSTIGITAIWFILQGIAEKASGGNQPLIGERFRFIGPKAATAKGSMTLFDEEKGIEITVTRKLTKSGSELSFRAPDGYELDQRWLNDLFNIFMIAPKKFTELSSKDQAIALGIDTKVYDEAIAALKQEHTLINRDLRPYGNLVPVDKVERVDITELQKKKEEIRQQLNQQYHANVAHNQDLRNQYETDVKNAREDVDLFNKYQKEKTEKIITANRHFTELQVLGYSGAEVENWINSLPHPQPCKVYDQGDNWPKEPQYIPEMPDDTQLREIDQQILNATQINEKAFLYEQYVAKVEEGKQHLKRLEDNKLQQAAKMDARLEYIKGLKLPFSNLSIGEDGDLLFNGKPIKEPYFSTGELLKIIPILIATRKPKLKYIFLQDFNLLDEDVQAEIEKYLTSKGFQLVVELVGKSRIADKNCILLRDSVVVEDYATQSDTETLSL